MASINDFKLLNLKCLKYYDLLEKTVSFKTKPSSEMQKKTLWFLYVHARGSMWC